MLLCPVASWAAPAGTRHVTGPSDKGITCKVYTFGPPVSGPVTGVVFDRMRSLFVSPETFSENVIVKVIGSVFVEALAGVTLHVGMLSYVTDELLDAVLPLPAASLVAPVGTWHVTAPCAVGVTGIV